MKSFSQVLPYLFSIAVLILLAHGVHAQSAPAGTYFQLAPLDGGPSGEAINVSGSSALANYVNSIYKIAITVAGVLAVVMITLGGIEYMGSDSIFTKEQGKTKIWNAIIGLLLLISCFLILNTINPNLLSLNISNDLNSEAAATQQAATNDNNDITTGESSFAPITNGSQTSANQNDSLFAPLPSQSTTINNEDFNANSGQPTNNPDSLIQ